MLTEDNARRMLFNLGIKHGVSPKLISTRLLSQDDKNDILLGLISIDELDMAVKVWKAALMPDYANGHTDPYRPLQAIFRVTHEKV